MLKNKSKLIITLFIAIAMIFNYSVCFAVDVDTDAVIEDTEEDYLDDDALYDLDDDALVEDDSDEEDLDEEDFDEEYDEGDALNSDLYLIGKNEVTIDYDVDGNVYIIANTVNIKSQIGGDAFIIADTINIDGGYIYSNLFALANTLNIDGIIYDLYACANTVTIGEDGYIYRDAHSASETLNVFGSVRRNVTAAFSNIVFNSNEEEDSSQGTIYGDLTYFSSNEADIDESYVDGNITFNKQVVKGQSSVILYLSDAATYVATAVIVYLLVIWLTPKFKEVSKEMLSKKIGPVIGFGVLGLIVVPIAVILLMMLGITVKIAFAALALYLALLLIASSVFIIGLTEIVAEKLKIDNKWKILGLVACAAVIVWVIELIPFLGGLISFATIAVGLGLIVKYALQFKKKEENNSK